MDPVPPSAFQENIHPQAAGGAGLNFLQDCEFDAIRDNRTFLESQDASRSSRVEHDLG